MTENNQAAPGIFASTLLTNVETQERIRPPPASSSLALIDELVLDGGFRYGEITSLAGASGMGKTLIAFQAIASHLLNFDQGEVAFIDTTGAFSPLRLRNVLIRRLHQRSWRAENRHTSDVPERGKIDPGVHSEELVAKATGILDRVQVMRVFDFAGVIEAVAEVGQKWERKDEDVDNVSTLLRGDSKKEIDDSEEGSTSGDSPQSCDKDAANRNETHQARQAGQMGMIIVDTITNAVSTTISKSQVLGQALLANFMRSLRHLTFRRHICTLLINNAVSLSSSNNINHPDRPGSNASIFSSSVGMPALGKSFRLLLDSSIFLSAVPSMSAAAYGGGTHNIHQRNVGILEVLKDRFSAREGRWAAFHMIDGVEIGSP